MTFIRLTRGRNRAAESIRQGVRIKCPMGLVVFLQKEWLSASPEWRKNKGSGAHRVAAAGDHSSLLYAGAGRGYSERSPPTAWHSDIC